MKELETSERSFRIDRRKFIAGVGTGVVGTVAGCTGGGGGDNTSTTSTPTKSNSGSGNTDTTTKSSNKDFGGQELNVTLNVGAFGDVFKKYLIPQVEKKYNLKVNYESAFTSKSLTKIQANPNNPPDVAMIDAIGVEKASRKGWLEPISGYSDIVTNYGDIPKKFKHYGDTGVSWEVGEVFPVINTNSWDSPPNSWDAAIKNANSVSLVPFSWSGGPYLLLMASAIATGGDFGSSNLDVDAGFKYLEKNLKPKVNSTYGGVASAKQQLASGNVDTILDFWAYMVFDMFKNDAPVQGVWRPDPAAIPVAETLVVPKGGSKKEAAMAYVNEALSVEFQEKMSAEIGAGVTNENAKVADIAKKFGAPTAADFDQYTFPDFKFIWDNRDQWSERWAKIFTQ